MDDEENGRPGRRELLEGGSERQERRAGRPARRWPRWLLLPVALAAVTVGVHRQHDAHPSALPAPHAPTASQTGAVVVPRVARSRVTVTEVGHPLLDQRAGQLYARGAGVLVHIDLQIGRITTTRVPALRSGGPVSFFPAAGGAVIRPIDGVPGYLVRDGQPARELTGSLGRGGYVYPGPDPKHVWVETAGTPPAIALATVGSSRLGARVQVPHASIFLDSDGAGNLLVNAPDGGYEIGPGGLHRITPGFLVATGPTGWLTGTCDTRQRCTARYVRRTGGSRLVPGPPPVLGYPGPGAISPDGTTAALFRPGTDANPAVYLLDLATGRQHPVRAALSLAGGSTVAWSTDSSRLFAVAANGKVVTIDSGNGRIGDLGVPLPHLEQVALRVP